MIRKTENKIEMTIECLYLIIMDIKGCSRNFQIVQVQIMDVTRKL